MKKLAVLMIAVAALTSGCVVYDDSYRGHGPRHDGGAYRGDRDGDGVPNRVDRDRDGDGVSNRRDNRPDNPYRY